MIVHLLILSLVLLIVGAIVIAALVYAMAIVLLRPPRMTDGSAIYLLRRLSPGDLGLKFECLNFHIRDQRTGQPMRVAAWWIPCDHEAARGRCAIVIHGYADAKVGGIAWAPTLHALGFNVLAIDLRAHGESEGRYSTAGFWERHDVAQVIDELRAQRPDDAHTIVLFGVSLGAAVAVATAKLRPDDIAALILECPFADYRAAVRRHGELMRLPGASLQDAAIALAERLSGARFDEVRPVDLIPRLHCPVLIIRSCDDDFVPEEEAQRLATAIEPCADRVQCWTVAETGHVLGLANDPKTYGERLNEFLKTTLPRDTGVSHVRAMR